MRHLSPKLRASGVRLGRGGRFFVERDNHQIQIRRAFRQFVSERFAAKPAAMLTATNDDLAEIMFPGVAQDGFIFCRIGQGGGLRA